MNYEITAKFLITIVSFDYASCAIDGSFNPRPENLTRPGEDPCNPLYWYPRGTPEYCYTTTIKPRRIIRPRPIPVPLPPQPFYPPVYPPPMPVMPMMPPMGSFPGEAPQAVHFSVMAPPIPLPFGIPLLPSNPMLPVAGVQYNQFLPPIPPPPRPVPRIPHMIPDDQIDMIPQNQIGMIPQNQIGMIAQNQIGMIPQNQIGMIPQNQIGMVQQNQIGMAPQNQFGMIPQNQIGMAPQSQIGMVPGLPGMVSYDGGINIMPFSDAYSDLLEKHKQKMIRRRLQKFLDEYDRHPRKDRKKKW